MNVCSVLICKELCSLQSVQQISISHTMSVVKYLHLLSGHTIIGITNDSGLSESHANGKKENFAISRIPFFYSKYFGNDMFQCNYTCKKSSVLINY